MQKSSEFYLIVVVREALNTEAAEKINPKVKLNVVKCRKNTTNYSGFIFAPFFLSNIEKECTFW